MKSVLSEIYQGLERMDGAEERLELSEKEIEEIYDLEDEIENLMDDELREKYRELITLQGHRAAIEAEKSFIKGFRTAMRIMLDAMEKREE